MKLKDIQVGDEIVAGKTGCNCLIEGRVYRVNSLYDQLTVNCKESLHHVLYDGLLGNFTPFIDEKGGWIGVDLDGTLAVYDRWRGPYHIGAPIMPMVERVKKWLAEGRDVRIFTARMTDAKTNSDGTEHDLKKVREAIQAWCMDHIGISLPVTNVKDWAMRELWDDRAVQVRPNTGVTLADELTAIREATKEPKYEGGQNG